MATGKELGVLRTELGLSQRELADLLNLPPGTIATWERRREMELTAPGNFVYYDLLDKSKTLRDERQKLFSAYRK